MKLVELKCKNCGAILNVDENADKVVCQYCSAEFKIDHEVQHVQYDNMANSGYEFEKGRIQAQREEQERIAAIQREEEKRLEAERKEWERHQQGQNAIDWAYKSYAEKQNAASQKLPQPNERNKWVSLFLCLFLGYFGVHKFYEGKIAMGLLYLFTIGLFGIGVIVDILIIATKPTYYIVE